MTIDDLSSTTRTRFEEIAVIGVGKMGGGLARNLALSSAATVSVYDPDPEAVGRCVAVGALPVCDALSAASGADLVITSLPMPSDVLALYRSVSGVLGPDTIAMDVSTIDPHTARLVADRLGTTTRGHQRFVSCLLGKGPAQAESGEVPLFVGGDDAVLDELTPIFDCIGDSVHRMGTVEAATAFKLVSNLIGMTNLAVLAEGLTICREAGVSDGAFARALADTGGSSYQSEVRLATMMAGDHTSRFPVALALKDLRLTVDLATQMGVPVPVGSAGMSQLAQAALRGHSADDVDALITTLQPPAEPPAR